MIAISVSNKCDRFPEVALKEYGLSAGIGASMSVWLMITSVKASSIVSRIVDSGMATPMVGMIRSRFELGILNMKGRASPPGDEEELICGNWSVVMIKLRFATAFAPGAKPTTP